MERKKKEKEEKEGKRAGATLWPTFTLSEFSAAADPFQAHKNQKASLSRYTII